MSGDYQRFKKHTPTYQADFAGVFPNLLTNSISNSFDSDEEESISSGEEITYLTPWMCVLSFLILNFISIFTLP